MEKKLKCSCGKCNNKAEFFHSKCCGVHFEGVIEKNMGFVVCEKCGFVNLNICTKDIECSHCKSSDIVPYGDEFYLVQTAASLEHVQFHHALCLNG